MLASITRGHGWDSLGEYSDAAVVDILALLRLLLSEVPGANKFIVARNYRGRTL
jgi:hypothetical protein